LKLLSPKKQKEYLSKAQDVPRQYQNHWDKLYSDYFNDYRKMSKGRLPTRIESLFERGEYKYHSKLIPRMIPDAIKFLTVTADAALFNREKIFDFVGRRGSLDATKAKNSYDVVAYQWDVTNARKQMKKAIKDAASVGAGFLERHHYTDRRLNPQYVDVGGQRVFDAQRYDTVYAGPKIYRLAPEMVLVDPYARDLDEMTGYIKKMVVPRSAIIKEGVEGGLYFDYQKNIKKIEAGDFDEHYRDAYDVESDHQTQGEHISTPDFPVLLTEWWMSTALDGETPGWTVMTIANWEQNPILLRYETDPMLTGTHPLYMVQMSPVNDRLYGESVPEIAQGYMVEQFYKRNQAINLINVGAAVGGIVVMPSGMVDKHSVLAKLNKVLVSTGPAKGQIEHLKLDLSAYPSLIGESERIKRDAEHSLAQPPISRGIAPERRETATTTAIQDQNAKTLSNDPIAELEESMIKPIAKDFLLHTQLLVPDQFTIRVLGREKNYVFREVSREDILGAYDVKCHASSEITTKTIKQAIMNNMASLYLGNPLIRMDRQAFARKHFEINEIDEGDKIIDTTTDTQAEIQRENEMLLNGILIRALEHENHPEHIAGHMRAANEMGQQMSQNELYFILAHIQEHKELMAQLQGQQVPGEKAEQPTFQDQGEQLNYIGSDMNARISG